MSYSRVIVISPRTIFGVWRDRGDLIDVTDISDAEIESLIDAERVLPVPPASEDEGGVTGPTGATGPEGPTGPSGVNAPTSVDIETESLADDASYVSTVDLGNTYIINRVSTDRPARVRLYVSTEAQTADESRAPEVLPTGNHGVLLDIVTAAGNLDWMVSPAVVGKNLVADAWTAITVTNLSGSASTVAVAIDVVTLVVNEPGAS